MKILVTSGGTREYIDEVRVLTNISTGKLGAKIVDTIVTEWRRDNHKGKYEIYYVYVKGSEMPEAIKFVNVKYYEVNDVQSVFEVMEKLVPEMDVVIHPMAVSDFGFKHTDVKLKSNDPEAFIESLKERIYQTPKILSHIKKWNPKCYLISFKFENGLEHDELIRIARESLIKNGSDIVIANDKAEMKKLGTHMSYFVTKDNAETVEGKNFIAKEIYNRIKNL
jgi:phosphopantothenate---cysteine ligase (CTP)